MVFHDVRLHGPMKIKIITTQRKVGDNIESLSLRHQQQCDAFNEEHIVFFNEFPKFTELGNSSAMIYSSVLYTEKSFKPEPQNFSAPMNNNTNTSGQGRVHL